jgi:hypothetical protein
MFKYKTKGTQDYGTFPKMTYFHLMECQNLFKNIKYFLFSTHVSYISIQTFEI